MLAWEAALTFATTTTAGLGLINVVPGKTAGLLVIVVQGLNAATVVYKTGQWNAGPPPPPAPPVQVVIPQHATDVPTPGTDPTGGP